MSCDFTILFLANAHRSEQGNLFNKCSFDFCNATVVFLDCDKCSRGSVVLTPIFSQQEKTNNPTSSHPSSFLPLLSSFLLFVLFLTSFISWFSQCLFVRIVFRKVAASRPSQLRAARPLTVPKASSNSWRTPREPPARALPARTALWRWSLTPWTTLPRLSRTLPQRESSRSFSQCAARSRSSAQEAIHTSLRLTPRCSHALSVTGIRKTRSFAPSAASPCRDPLSSAPRGAVSIPRRKSTWR